VIALFVFVEVPVLAGPLEVFDPDLEETAPGRVDVTTGEVAEIDTVRGPSSTVK
jgi:hypothetical protein